MNDNELIKGKPNGAKTVSTINNNIPIVFLLSFLISK